MILISKLRIKWEIEILERLINFAFIIISLQIAAKMAFINHFMQSQKKSRNIIILFKSK